MYKDIELRKLPVGLLNNVINILETNDDWKKVMSFVPKDPQSDSFEPKYNNQHMRLIEDDVEVSNRKCTEILLDEWGTSGRIRPTLITLYNVVLKAGIYRAADKLAEIMGTDPPPRPKDGPEAEIEIEIPGLNTNSSFNFSVNFTKEINTNNEAIQNRTTKQMKSATDMIEFSTDVVQSSSKDTKSASDMIGFSTADELPKIGPLKIHENTSPKKVDSNLIEFSKAQSIDVSKYLPYFEVLMAESTGKIDKILTNADTEQLQKHSDKFTDSSYSGNYQTSLPNIYDYSAIDTSIIQDSSLINLNYSELHAITNGFANVCNLVNGLKGPIGKIGSGGFGEVFVGHHNVLGALAIKRSHNNLPLDIIMKVFNTEVKYLLQFRHNNIVPIIGYSNDGPSLCIVSQYIEGGSLNVKIAEKVLTSEQRMNIILGIAEGLRYVHTSGNTDQSDAMPIAIADTDSTNKKKNNFLHGDVKSANILLTEDYVPKLCDFGLSKEYDKTVLELNVMGTSAYMAPEGFHGTITQKIDIYSFGVVLLELLTGHESIIKLNNEAIAIKTYVEENYQNDITSLLDPAAGEWKAANEIYKLAMRCLNKKRHARPSMEDICDILYEINSTN